MQARILQFSEIDLTDRLTVEHYVSQDLELIEKLSQGTHDLIPLGEFCQVRGGKRLPPKARYSETGIPYVRVVDIGDFEVELDDVVHISPELHDGIKRYQLKHDDIAIVIVGATIGKVAVFKSTASPCNFNENMARITIKNGQLNPEYLLTYLQSRYGQAYISWLTGGAAQAKLSLERIRRIEVPLPPRPVQDRIAGVMQAAYAARREMLEEAKRLFETMDAWALELLGISLDDFTPPRFYTTPAHKIQSRWDVIYYQPSNPAFQDNDTWCSFGQYAKTVRDTFTPASQDPKEHYYVGIQSMANDPFSAKDNALVLPSNQINGLCKRFRGGDILLARLGPTITNKKSAIVPADVDTGCGSPEFLVIRPEATVDRRFLLWLVKADFLVEQMLQKTRGATPSRARLYSDDLLKLRVPKASYPQQQAIGEDLETRRTKAQRLRAEAEEAVAEAKARVERMILGEEKAA